MSSSLSPFRSFLSVVWAGLPECFRIRSSWMTVVRAAAGLALAAVTAGARILVVVVEAAVAAVAADAAAAAGTAEGVAVSR